MASLPTPPLRVPSAMPGRYVFRNVRGETIDFHDGRYLIVKRVRGEGLAPATDSTSGGIVQRGLTLRRTMIQPRVLSFECLSVCDTRFYLEELHAQLARVLDPELGIGRYERRRGDGTLYYLDCKLTSTLDLEMSFDAIHNGEPIPFELTAYDPDFYAVADTVVPVLSSGSTKTYPPLAAVFPAAGQPLYFGEPATLVYEDTAPTEPVIVVNGPISNLVVANLDTNEAVEVGTSIPVGARLTVDLRRGLKTIVATVPVPAPLVAPTGAIVNTTGGVLTAGGYFLAYTFVSDLGETVASPTAGYVLTGSTNTITTPAIVLPFGVQAINWYLSAAASSAALFRVVTGGSGAPVLLTAVAASTLPPPLTTPAGETVINELNSIVQGFNFWRLTPGENHIFIGQAPTGSEPTNLLPNPSFTTNTSSWATSGGVLTCQTSTVKYGTAAGLFTPSAVGYQVSQPSSAITGATAGREFLGGVWLHGSGSLVGKTLYILMFETGGADVQSYSQQSVLIIQGWQWVSLARTMVANDRTGLSLHIIDLGNTYGSGDLLILDGARIQEGLSQAGIVPDPTNLLTNGAFEAGATDWAPINGAFTRETAIVKFGAAAGRFTATAAGYQAYQDTVSFSNATAGRPYFAGFWVCGVGAAVGRTLYALLFELGGALAGVYSQQLFTLTAGWQYVGVVHTLVANDRTYLRLTIVDGVSVGASGDAFIIDGARIHEVRHSLLTLSGNEITDTLRLAAVQGDGRLNDRTTGIFGATTNLAVNPNFETNVASWTIYFGSETLTRVTAEHLYSDAAAKIGIVAGNAGGMLQVIAVAANTRYGFSVHVKGTAGYAGYVKVDEYTAAPALVISYIESIIFTGAWQEIVFEAVSAATTTQVQVHGVANGPNASDAFFDGFQFETGHGVTPFTPTSRAAARLRAPASLLSTATGCIVVKLRNGTVLSSLESKTVLDLRDDANNLVRLAYEKGSWRVRRAAAGLIEEAAVVDAAWTYAEERLIVAGLLPAGVALSVDGAPARAVTLWDDFNRADGAPGTAPSGQAWGRKSATGVTQLAVIANGALAATTPGASTGSTYNTVDLGSAPTRMTAEVTFSGASPGGAVALIANPNGDLSVNGIPDILNNSLHPVFTDAYMQIGVFEAGAFTILQTFYYGTACTRDGVTKYRLGWAFDAATNTIVVEMPDGLTGVYTNSRMTAVTGRYATWEHYWGVAGTGPCRILSVAAETVSDTPHTGGGHLPTLVATQMDLGSVAGTADHLNGYFEWLALGDGTFTDSLATALAALATTPEWEAFPAEFGLTGLWTGNGDWIQTAPAAEAEPVATITYRERRNGL